MGPPPADRAIASAGLGLRDRGFALAAVRALGAGAQACCASRGAALAAQALLLLDPARRAEEVHALGRATPEGISWVHPSWYQPPPPSRRGEAARYLERRAYAHLVAMPGRHAEGPAGAGRGLGGRLPSDLEPLLVALGRRRLAIAFAGAPRQALGQLLARLGQPAAAELLAEVSALAGRIDAEEVRSAQRALFEGPLDRLAEGGAPALFARVGAGWMALALDEDRERLRALAQALPRPIGQVLLHSAPGASDGERAAARRAVEAADASGPRLLRG